MKLLGTGWNIRSDLASVGVSGLCHNIFMSVFSSLRNICL